MNGRISTMPAAIGLSSVIGVAGIARAPPPWSMFMLSELARRSRRMARQSAWQATTQNPMSLRWIGARSRISA